MNVHRSVSKSVFPSVHRASMVPAALSGDAVQTGYLLLETSDFFLLETGDKILLG